MSAAAARRAPRRPEVFYVVRRSPVAPVAPAPLRAGLQRAIVLRPERPDVIVRAGGLAGGAVVLGPSHVDAARAAIARTRRGELVRVRLWLAGPRPHHQPRHGETMNPKTTTTPAGADLAPLESAAEQADDQADDLDAAPAAEQADAPRVEALELTSPPDEPPTGDPMNDDDKKQNLATEAKQLEKSIADAKAAGQPLRAAALEARRQRVLARVSA